MTATFDEKLRLLLDPNYQSSPAAAAAALDNSCAESQQLFQSPIKKGVPLKQRSRSFQQEGDDEPEANSNSRSKPVELKRGRLVDKTKEKPPFLRGHSASNILHGQQAGPATHLRRNNSLTKEEKHELNVRKRAELDTSQVAALLDEKENEDNRCVKFKMCLFGWVVNLFIFSETCFAWWWLALTPALWPSTAKR